MNGDVDRGQVAEDAGAGVLVVGAIHLDLVVAADRLPSPGVTVVGSDLVSHGGGKGANAALAARRSGASVTLVGAVGDDEYADLALTDLRRAGVDVDPIQVIPGRRTGTALIVVDTAGENQIAVAPGAGQAVSATEVARHIQLRRSSLTCVLVSTEVAAEAVAAAVEQATAQGLTCILNTAPPRPELVDLFDHGPILSPNESELRALDVMIGGTGRGEPEVAALRLAIRTNQPVVVTLGAMGALIVWPSGDSRAVPAPRAVVRDTTGAGDTFNGVLACCVAAGNPLTDSVELAVVAASMSVGHAGARAGMPTADALADEWTRTVADGEGVTW